ncbi:unnamed protein product [Sphagnum balticum]
MTNPQSPTDLPSSKILEATCLSSPPQSLSMGNLVDQSPSSSSTQNVSDQTSLMPLNGVHASKSIQQPPLTNEIPIASANSISVSISLAEPSLYLTGFEQSDVDSGAPAILRGSLIVRITKTEKIKSISLHFLGKSRTEWPEGEATLLDPDVISARSLTRTSPKSTGNEAPLPAFEEASDDSRQVGSYRAEHPFLQLGFLGNFGKDQSAKSQVVMQTGYRLFHPGDYVYNFELVLDPHLPESIDIEHGKISIGELHACEDQLYAKHKASEVQRHSIEIGLRACIVERLDKIRSVRGEGDSCDYVEEAAPRGCDVYIAPVRDHDIMYDGVIYAFSRAIGCLGKVVSRVSLGIVVVLDYRCRCCRDYLGWRYVM